MLFKPKRIKFAASTLLAWIVLGQPITAQIVPDNSLPNNSFVISPDGKTHLINGGTQAGPNLFHSFLEFSINQGETAFFNNSLEIQHIFSRITGTSLSKIDGLIAANGFPNLFLFNPNGITFGPDAAIAVGSFFASSADRVIFADGFEFRADGQKTPLLSFNRPIGLGFNNPGPIEVQGNGNPFQYVAFAAPLLPIISADNILQLGGLRAFPGGKIALIGGEIRLTNASLVGVGGTVELVGIERGTYNLNLPENSAISAFKDIHITSSAIGLTGLGLGEAEGIRLWGRDINVLNGSLIFVQNVSPAPTGNIELKAFRNIAISGNTLAHPTIVRNLTLGGGNSGEIRLTAGESFKVTQVANIDTATFSQGNSGKIEVTAPQLLVSDSVPGGPLTGISTTVNPGARGTGGDIVLNVGRLQIDRGGAIVTTTIGDAGAAGNLWVKAKTVGLSGASPDGASPSQLSTVSFGSGDAGNITINVETVEIVRGGNINSLGVSSGNAGDIAIAASEEISLRESPQSVDFTSFGLGDTNLLRQSGLIQSSIGIPPAQVLAFFGISAAPTGNAGNVSIQTQNLQLSDNAAISIGNVGTGSSGSLMVRAREVALDNASSLSSATLNGDGGNLLIRANRLSLNNFSGITVQAGGSVAGLDLPTGNVGTGGNLSIDVSEIRLANNSILSAQSLFGSGGNVILNIHELILDRSQITAEAGGAGNGGNIAIEASGGAVLFEGAITASAIAGTGGNIQIDTPVFLATPDSRISASSQLGIDGIVEIRTPDNNLFSAIVPLQAQIIEADETIAQSCLSQNRSERSSFTIRGPGSLPPTPETTPSRFIDSSLPHLRPLPPSDESHHDVKPNAIVKTEDGQLLLINICSTLSKRDSLAD